MLTLNALFLSVAPVLCLSSRMTPRRPMVNIYGEDVHRIQEFPWGELKGRTGFGGIKELQGTACLATPGPPGPQRSACNGARYHWRRNADENNTLPLDRGQCKSITHDCCETVACANDKDISPDINDITDAIWDILAGCDGGAKGGISRKFDDEKGLYVQIELSREKECYKTKPSPKPSGDSHVKNSRMVRNHNEEEDSHDEDSEGDDQVELTMELVQSFIESLLDEDSEDHDQLEQIQSLI